MKPIISLLTINAAQRFGASVALETDEATLTFKEVDDLASRFASGLSERGIGLGDRVILHLPNDWQWVVAYYAIARVGAVVIPANFLLSIEEVAYIVADCQAKCFIGPSERCARLSAVVGEGTTLTCLIHANGSQKTSMHQGALTFDDLLASKGMLPVDLEPGDLWTIAYTSGTTGAPKGAMLTHAAVFHSIAHSSTIHVRSEGERVISALPFPHVYGNVVMNSCFLVGMALITTRKFEVDWAFRKIQEKKATLFEGVPTMYHYMLGHPAVGDVDFSSLRRCTVGGQNMPVSKVEEIAEVFGCPLLELWGMTEVAGPATTHSPYLPSKPGSVGMPFPGLEVRVADCGDPGQILSHDQTGELQLRGVTVMLGYYNNKDATEASILPGGWLRTGDIATIDGQGYIYIVDRLKDIIITAGYNIYPAEVEQALAKHPAVALSAVVSVADVMKGELAKAFVVLRPSMSCSEEELMAHCKRELASYKVPRIIEFIESLPVTSTGKILRRALRG